MANFNQLVPAEEERLFCLVEEMGEVLQIVGKIGRHGYESTHPAGGPRNRELLEREMGDLLYWMQTMGQKYDIDWTRVEEAATAKAVNVRPYLHPQGLGRLKGGRE